jgi:hypothetical protein
MPAQYSGIFCNKKSRANLSHSISSSLRVAKEDAVPDELVKVHDVAQEYWYIDRIPCSCGGSFRKEMQMLQDLRGTPIDRLVSNCDKCGSVREFLFDISAFHGPAITVENMHLARLAEGVTET